MSFKTHLFSGTKTKNDMFKLLSSEMVYWMVARQKKPIKAVNNWCYEIQVFLNHPISD